MRFLCHPVFALVAFTASVAVAQTPTFTVVDTSALNTTLGNAGKGVLEPQVAGFTGIAFGAGLFVAPAASTGETVMRWATSPDGTTWTARSQPITGGTTFQTSKIHFLNGKFLFFLGLGDSASGSTWAYTSTDGLTWTGNKVANGRINPEEFDASPTLTVVAAHNGAQFYSTDLVTWTASPVVPNAAGFDHLDLTYGAGKFFSSINGFGGTTYSSSDGATWTAIPATANIGGSTAEAGNGIVLFNVSNNRYTTTDGTTFTKISQVSNPTTWLAPGGNARFAGGRFVATSIDLAAAKQGYMGSSDGITWTPLAYYPSAPTVPIGQSRLFFHTDIAFGNGKYVIAGQDIAQTLTTKTTLPLVLVVDAPAAPTPPVISAQPAATGAVIGRSATLSVTASGSGNTYQWRKDGTNIAGATAATYTIASVTAASAGNYSVVITNSAGTVTSSVAALSIVTASAAGRLANMSIRTNAGTGNDTLIVGLGLGGAGTSGNKAILIRAIGPTLGAFGVTGALADPVMTVLQGQTTVATNDDWAGTFDFGSVGAFALAGTPIRDSAIYNPTLAPNSYSIQIVGKNNATGIALAEIYDATPSASFAATTPRLVNVSARTQVGTGDNILIAGFAVGGQSSVRVLIRAVGPTLGAFGVGGALTDPKLEIYSGSTKINENDNWGGTAELKSAFTSVAAFAFANDTSRDAALVATLAPGTYTAQISGVANTTGVALVEIYELP